jgi:hypothetical protein
VPADIHLLPHRGCIHKPLLIGERRFLGMFCPDGPALITPPKKADTCRLCGYPNEDHRIAYRIRWNLREEHVKNLVKHAQCPRCSLRVRNQMLIEIHKLRGEGAPEYYTLPEFSALLKSAAWTQAHFEYHARKRRGDTPHPLRTH